MFNPSDDPQPTPRPLWTRLSQRLMDWFWSILTRDLRPARAPSRLTQVYHLLSDLCWYGRSLDVPDWERDARPDA